MRGKLFLLVVALCCLNVMAAGESCKSNPCKDFFDLCNANEICEKHKGLFPMSTLEIFGSIVLGITIGLAAAGGIGGGGLVMPIVIIFFGFTANQAVPLSNANIFVASVIRFIINYKQKHPEANKLSIDYEVSIVLLPMILLGTTLGVILNEILPSLIVIILLTLILIYMGYKCLVKFRQVWKKENEQKAKIAAEKEKAENRLLQEDSKDKSEIELLDDKSKEDVQKINQSSNLDSMQIGLSEYDKSNSNSHKAENEKIRERIVYWENSHWHMKKVAFVWLTMFVLIIVSLLRGSKHSSSLVGIKSCSALDWIILVLFAIFCIGETFIVVRMLRKDREIKEKVGYTFHPADIQFTTKNSIKLAVLALAGGTAAGALGIGGGMIFNPLLLELGMLPIVASATGMFLVLYSSFSTTLQFVISNQLDWPYAGWTSLFSIIGTIAGILYVNMMMKRTGRTSILVLLLTILIFISLVVMPVKEIWDLVVKVQKGQPFIHFNSPCKG